MDERVAGLVARFTAAAERAVPWDHGRTPRPPGPRAEGVDPRDELVMATVELPGGALDVLRPADPDALPFEPVGGDGSADGDVQEWHPPHWARIWPSATVLAGALCHDELDGARVLELGCGLGLPSLAAARAGARVLATDLSPAAVALTRVNAERNGLAVDVAVADWAVPDVLVDAGPWDLVVAADVLYGVLAETLLGDLLPRLAGPGGAVLLADPGREPADRFLHAAGAWDVSSHSAGGGGVSLHLLRPRPE